MFNWNQRVVCFFAHTDDEMVCAGTLHRLARSGSEVQVWALGWAGTAEHPDGWDCGDTLCEEWERSMRLIGANGFDPHDCCKILGEEPRSQASKTLHERSQWVADVAYKVCERVRPDVVISLSPEDENPAHAVVGTQVRRVTRGRVKHHLECQFPWNHSLGRPNLFVELSHKDMEIKRQVIAAYRSQHFRYNYGRMLMAQAEADGLAVKVTAAEKFEIVRSVI